MNETVSANKSAVSEAKKAVLAKLLAEAKVSRPHAPKPRTTSGPVALSAQQRSLWLTDQIAPGTAAYNVPYVFHLQGTLDDGAMERALSSMMDKHCSLRTYFDSSGETPLQDVDQGAPVPLEIAVVKSPEAALEEFTADANTGFDLSKAPLWRARIAHVDEHDHWLLIVIHHIVFDGTSAAFFFEDLTRFYAAAVAGEQPEGRLEIDYLDYAEWQRERLESGAWEAHLDYWREQLQGLELMQVVSDRPLPARYTFNGSTCTIRQEGAKNDIDAIARRYGISSFVAHFTVLTAALMRYCATADVVLGIPTANRSYEELEPVIGYFINMLPIRVANDPTVTFEQLVHVCKKSVQDAMAHGEVPLEQIVEVARIPRDSSRAGIFQTGMTVVSDDQQQSELFEHPSLTVESVDLPAYTARYQLSFSIRENGPDVQIELEYSTDLFEPQTAEAIVRAFFLVARHAARNSDTAVERISLFDGDEYEQERQRGLGADAIPTSADPASWFVQQAAAMPDQIAVIDEYGSTGYRELSAMAESLRHRLVESGVEAGDRVAVLSHRTAHLPASYLAVLAAGAAIVPLDPVNPSQRLDEILQDSLANVIIISPELTGPDLSVPVIELPSRCERIDCGRGPLAPSRTAALDAPAYVLYTSGSTGKPKGVIVSRLNLANFVANTIDLFDLTPLDRVLGYASVGFDVSMFEMFSALLSGASVHYVPTEQRLDMLDLARFIKDHQITVTDLPPSVMSLLDPNEYADLRIVFVGGEPFSSELVDQWAPGRRFFNGYGPTECTVTMTVHECEPGQAGQPPMGLPMRGHVAHVVNGADELQVPGLIGELVVGGTGLAIGYLNRPEAQATAFIDNPFGTTPDGRLYRTGDFVRRNVDGNLVYVGRKDSQVKIGGVRIELGEVEAQLRSHPNVRQCHARVNEIDGVKRLDAYVVLAAGPPEEPARLREFIAARVMSAMVPSTITVLEAMPLTSSGKVDVARLPEPMQVDSDLVPPATDTERRVLDEVYLPILGADRLSVTSGFFEAGGTSLQAARLLARIRKVFDVEIPLADLFSDSTPRRMARRIDKSVLSRLPEDELLALLEKMSDEEAAALLEDA